MESESCGKRKFSNDSVESDENKRLHEEKQFSQSEISAESTQVEDLDSTEKAEEILDSLVSEQSKTEIEDSELLKTIVNVCNKEKKRTDQEDETKRNFKKKLEEKEQEIDKLKERNRELRKNNILLETEKEILEDKIKQDSMNIKRYQKAIIKLNNIANVV